MPTHLADFLGLDAEQPPYDEAAAVVLPVPFERTTSYGRGTAGGPAALLEASTQVELYDRELDAEPVDQGIVTVAPCDPAAEDLETALAQVEAEARRHLEAGKFLVSLGGDHGLTLAPVRAALDHFGAPLGVVQLDAHADLRQSYGGTPYSHASVMRRVLDLGVATLAVGLRSLSTPEARLIRERGLPVIWADELERDAAAGSTERFETLLAELPERVYLTFDVDYFDPSLVPATGTPEPGGGTWHPTLALLRRLFERKHVVAMDVVELAPRPGWPASDFVAARLVYKALGYRWAARR